MRGSAAASGLSLFISICFVVPGLCQETAPVAKDKIGLLGGMFEHGEAPGKTREEIQLSMKALPSAPGSRPFWLYVPKSYAAKKTTPLVVVLHKRTFLGSYSSGMKHTVKHLPKYAGAELKAWRAVADKEGFLLALPLGDVDILHMGMSWNTRERVTFFESLLNELKKTHAVDTAKVFVAATGEGAYAAIATAVRRGDLIRGVVAANPSLYDGAKKRGRVLMPEPVQEMLKAGDKNHCPLLIYAGGADKKFKVHGHGISSIKGTSRYQDTGSIPFSYVQKVTKLFEEKGHKVQLKKIPGKHYAPFPLTKASEAWAWMKDISAKPLASAE